LRKNASDYHLNIKTPINSAFNFGVQDKEQAWVTLAISDVEALQALVLAKSLEQTLTTRHIFILVTENVSTEIR